jgi:hypothetical protein
LAQLLEARPVDTPFVSWVTNTDGGALRHETVVSLDTTDNKSRDFIAQRLCALLILTKLPQRSLAQACEALAEVYRAALTVEPDWQPPPTTVRKLTRIVKSERPSVVYEG